MNAATSLSLTRTQVAIIGGGPAGLAAGIEAAQRGLRVIVFERQPFPVDKACGEGLLPAGLAALERLGALAHLDLTQASRFEAIRYVQEDGRFVDALLAPPGGLGVRRLALSAALVARAREVGVVVHEGGVRSHSIRADGVSLSTERGDVEADVLVAADGLNSPLRQSLGLQLATSGPRRFGLRRHFRLEPWAPRVEVHFSDGVEAYVTPAGVERVGVAFLWTDSANVPHDFDALLARFPSLQAKIGTAPYDSEVRGAGPLRQEVRRRTLDRVALLGDAAGYVDAITGEGLSLAFEGARALGACLPDVLARAGAVAAFAPYEEAASRAFEQYARLTGALVWVASRPRLRRMMLNRLIEWPSVFGWSLRRLLPVEQSSASTSVTRAARAHPPPPASPHRASSDPASTRGRAR